MRKVFLGKTLSEEITEVTKNDEHEVAEVCRDQNVVRWLFYLVFSDGFFRIMLGSATITLGAAVAKLGVNGGENLL